MAKMKVNVKERETSKKKTLTNEDLETLVRVREILEETIVKNKKRNRRKVRRNESPDITEIESLGLGLDVAEFRKGLNNSPDPCCFPKEDDACNFATGGRKGEDGTGLNTGGKGGK